MFVLPLALRGFDNWLGCVVAVLIAATIQGEAQVFFSVLVRPKARLKDVRFSFNPLEHLDLRSLPVFVLGGWVWNKAGILTAPEIRGHWVYPSLTAVAGAVGNLLLAGIFTTLHDLFFASPIMKIAIMVNLQVALGNLLLPIPPLALGRAFLVHLPAYRDRPAVVDWVGSALLTAWIAAEYWRVLPGPASGIHAAGAWIYRLLMGPAA